MEEAGDDGWVKHTQCFTLEAAIYVLCETKNQR